MYCKYIVRFIRYKILLIKMVSVGKWLAYIVFTFLIVFLVLVFFASNFLDQFIKWTLGLIGLITAGAVVYIIVNFNRKRR